LFNISFFIKYNLILQIKCIIEKGLKLTRGLSFPSTFFLLAHTDYLSLFIEIQKGNTVAELVGFTMRRMDATIFSPLRVNWKDGVSE
jgi:hypothetical protein